MLYPAKTGTMRFGPMAGPAGCAYDLIFECTSFWPQTDQVYLFLAAAPQEPSQLHNSMINSTARHH